MTAIEALHLEKDLFRVRVREHTFLVDQPLDAGGSDLGPTPVEFFAASLAACVGFYAERFMRRHGIRTDGLSVGCDFNTSDDSPARVSDIEVRVVLPEGFPESRRKALLRLVERCTVHNSMRVPPAVHMKLEAPELRPLRWAAL